MRNSPREQFQAEMDHLEKDKPPAPKPRPAGANMFEAMERSPEEIARRVAWLKAYKEQVARDRAAAQA